MEMPYGYYTQCGYMGRLSSGIWMLFATQQDYIEYLNEAENQGFSK